ncbi:Threonine/homoserine/homoserine lactone efflux protein [Tistlia consotensis]|uniref:Threonine/homoserine/homoserine lactone efflux protein n=1 Tax=Tistlia consotensis USBA 355 TaxID=560819 RepID=A0A1Y6CNE1_9PROT|nr:LysE family translocator [Tistlia consotensis]SMF64259.1 Threonine/homoserine/homoserine lactone efflux protein [Tistlia consotensis USBA 355]SNR97621.1 Threonine/homoserine/homoserine lactone efflux protein [Tistlia consotensis]
MTLASWLALLLALTLLGLTPGPGWAAVVGTALGRGFAAGAAMALGVGLGDVVFVLLAVFGLALLAETLGELFLLVRLAGAGYLVFLGVQCWRRPPRVADSGAAPKPRSLSASFVGGFALTLGNPKVIAFYLGFLPAFLDLGRLGGGDVALVAGTAFTVIAGLLTGYAALAAASRRLLLRERVARWFGRVTGSCLIASGIAVATR